MEQYKNLDIDVIKNTLADLFSGKDDKWPMGIKHHGNNIYSISSGKSIIYTTEVGVEEFNKLLKEDLENGAGHTDD